VVEPDTGLMPAVRLTKTNGSANSDANVGAELVAADPTIAEGQQVQVLGDSAYATGDMLHALAAKKWTPLLKPWPIKPAVEGGFTIDDFTHDAGAGTLTCPAGQTRAITKSRKAVFGIACSACPLRTRCTTAKTGRTIELHPHDLLQRAHRQRAADEGFRASYRQHRPMVERSIAWLTRGNRRVPYRGIEKNNNWLHHRVAALNLRRLLAMGLTINNGSWALG
jgi:Transposase DDE domain